MAKNRQPYDPNDFTELEQDRRQEELDVSRGTVISSLIVLGFIIAAILFGGK